MRAMPTSNPFGRSGGNPLLTRRRFVMSNSCWDAASIADVSRPAPVVGGGAGVDVGGGAVGTGGGGGAWRTVRGVEVGATGTIVAVRVAVAVGVGDGGTAVGVAVASGSVAHPWVASRAAAPSGFKPGRAPRAARIEMSLRGGRSDCSDRFVPPPPDAAVDATALSAPSSATTASATMRLILT